jgi:hypothetical protein
MREKAEASKGFASSEGLVEIVRGITKWNWSIKNVRVFINVR